MATIKLRELYLPGGVTAPYQLVTSWYDTVQRTPFTTQEPSQANANPFELAKDTPVGRYQVRADKELVVLYDGNGSVYTRPAAGIVISNLEVKFGLLPVFTSNQGAADACVDITGRYGYPPYQISFGGLTGAAQGYRASGVSPSESFPVRFPNLREGNYEAVILDALGNAQSLLLTVTAGSGEAQNVRLYETMAATQSLGIHWRYNYRDLVNYTHGSKPPGVFSLPYGTLVDGYFTLSNTHWRRVYADGTGLVYYTDQVLQTVSSLEVENIIAFHPDRPQDQTGGLILEMRADHYPLTYRLQDTSGLVLTNTTGHFDGLGVGEYDILITDSLNFTYTVVYELKCPYRLWKQLVYDDLDSQPLRAEFWLRGYDGAVGTLCGQGSPVVLKSDGLNGPQGGQGDIPTVVGTACELNLLVPAGLFERIVIGDDRLCRVDVYYANGLEFRGYVQPDIYETPLLDGLQPVGLTATDGLAGLKDTLMLGHQEQRLSGHQPILNTLLHCLSRTGVALPLRIFTNRRENSMATSEAPELAVSSNRTGYWEESKNEPIDQRQVLDADVQLLGGTLIQREGTWQVRSALEAAKDAMGRAYKPAGTPLPDLVATAPTALIQPPASGRLHWLLGNQRKAVRAGWKSLAGTTDWGWQENAYAAGKVFSDFYAWLGNGSGSLRPLTGWQPAPGQLFSAQLVAGGEKGGSKTTLWPRSSNFSAWNLGQYLQGPPLPLVAGMEAVPAALQVTGRFVPTEFYTDREGKQVIAPTNGAIGVLPYELVVDGQPTGVHLLNFELSDSATAKDIVVSQDLPELPTGTTSAELRLYAWYVADTQLYDKAATIIPLSFQLFKAGEAAKYDFSNGTYRLFVAKQDGAQGASFQTGAWPYYFAEVTPTNRGLGNFYVSEVGVQLTPQNATWDSEDNVRADGPAGTVRPSEALEVFHADPPLSAGIFGGNLYAFTRAAGLSDGTQPTSWSRAVDKKPSPLLESNVLDLLALRANPSRLLPGTLRHRQVAPVRLLDTLDTPYEPSTTGRRFLVAGIPGWDMRASQSEVKLLEIGVGTNAPDPLSQLPDGVRIVPRSYQYLPGQYTPYVRLRPGGGVRVRP